MRILSIETSCDETAASVLRGRFEPLSSVVASQHEIHGKYGGIVPELACRRHLEMIRPVVREAIAEAGVRLEEIGLVAVTRGPGLVGALLVGLSYAKALAFGRGLPLVGVNHLEGHIMSAFIHRSDTQLPAVALVASGGHTELFFVKGPGRFERLGGTRDDAAGETFDKVAKSLGLGYPGGPAIERMAEKGKPVFSVPVAMAGSGTCDFSFSGPKTAVRNIIRRFESERARVPVADICASAQAAIVDALEMKTRLAIKKKSPKSVLVTGGVACNRALGERIGKLADEFGIEAVIPPPSLCSDNAAMIAAAGACSFLEDPGSPVFRDYLEMDADARWLL